MLEYEAMATPMDSNLKLLVGDSLELVDITKYRHIIGSLNVSNKYQTRHLFCCEHLNSISCSTKTGSPSSCKTCDEISKRDYRLWSILMATQMQIGMEVSQTGKVHQVDAFF